MNNKVLVIVIATAIFLCSCGARVDSQPHTSTVGSSQGTGNSVPVTLPVVSGIYDIANGFFRPIGKASGDHVIALVGGAPQTLQLNRESISVTHKGVQVAVDFGWYLQDGRLYAGNQADTHSVDTIDGSDRYARLTFGTQLDAYGYLIDLQENKVLDPLAMTDPEVVASIDQIYFSSDGAHALLVCDAGDTWRLLDCSDGTTRLLEELTGMERCAARFMADGDHIRFWPQDKETELYVYSIRKGESRRVSAHSAYAEGWEMQIVDGYLTVIDNATGAQTKTQFTQAQILGVYWYGQTQVMVHTSQGQVYLLGVDGNAQAACTLKRG